MKNQLIILKTAIAFFQLAVVQQPIPDLAGLLAGSALALGVFRILKGWPVQYFILGGYAGVMAMTLFAPPSIVGIA